MAERLPMDKTMQDEVEEVHLLDLVLVLAKRMRLILTITVTIILLTVIYSLVTPKIYEGTAKIIPPQKGGLSTSAALLSQLSSVVGMPAGLTGGSGSPSDLYIGMLQSRTIVDAIIDRFELTKLYDKKTRSDTRIALSKVFRAQSDKKSGIITVQVEDKDAKRAADMANAFIEELVEVVSRLSISDASQRRLFFEGQLKETHAALIRAEDALQKFQETTGAIKIDNQSEAVFKGIAELRAQVAAKEIQLKVMRTYSTPYNREVKQVEEELAGMKEQLKKLDAGADSSYGSTVIPTAEMPTLGLEYLRKTREFKFQEALYEILTKQYESARLDEANDAPTIQVLDSAVVSDKKIKPKRALMVVAATVAGFFIALLAAFMAEYWEKVSCDPEEGERLAKISEYLAPITNNGVVAKVRGMFGGRSSEF